jgi:hypothetical protein
LKETIPYVVVVQSSLFDGYRRRVVVPLVRPLMASPNSPTRGHPNFPQAAQPDYDPSAWMAKRAAASLSL